VPVLLFLLAFAHATTPPNTSQVQIRNVQVNGDGCKPGTASVIVTSTDPNNPVADFLEILYSEFQVTRGKGVNAAESRKQCTIVVDLFIPSGLSFTLIDVEWDGFADLPKGYTGLQTSSYKFPFFSNTARAQSKVKGPFNGNYGRQDTLATLAQIWSPCGRTIPLNIQAQVQLTGALTNDQATMSIDTTIGKVTQKWGFQWQTCNPPSGNNGNNGMSSSTGGAM